MTLDAESCAPAGLRRVWSDRPWLYSSPLWALILALDFLRWPWGEDILAGLFWLVGLVRARRRRPAIAWAKAQPNRHPWPLALGLCGFRGRWVARSTLVGVRRPADLGRRVVIRGEEHLMAPAPQGTILLGFHLGPPNADVALRILGHPMAWLGSARKSRARASPAWAPFLASRENLSPPDGDAEWFWAGYLYRARRILLEGRTIFVMADSLVGRELFAVTLPGGVMTVRSGWFTLWRQTGARVVPVTTHLDGRMQVITAHPPLPVERTDQSDADAYRSILSGLAEDYVRRFPEQCPALVFPTRTRRRPDPARNPSGVRPPREQHPSLHRPG